MSKTIRPATANTGSIGSETYPFLNGYIANLYTSSFSAVNITAVSTLFAAYASISESIIAKVFAIMEGESVLMYIDKLTAQFAQDLSAGRNITAGNKLSAVSAELTGALSALNGTFTGTMTTATAQVNSGLTVEGAAWLKGGLTTNAASTIGGSLTVNGAVSGTGATFAGGTVTATTFTGALNGNANTATSANSATTAGSATNATNVVTGGTVNTGSITGTSLSVGTGAIGGGAITGTSISAGTGAIGGGTITASTKFVGPLDGNATSATSATSAGKLTNFKYYQTLSNTTVSAGNTSTIGEINVPADGTYLVEFTTLYQLSSATTAEIIFNTSTIWGSISLPSGNHYVHLRRVMSLTDAGDLEVKCKAGSGGSVVVTAPIITITPV